MQPRRHEFIPRSHDGRGYTSLLDDLSYHARMFSKYTDQLHAVRMYSVSSQRSMAVDFYEGMMQHHLAAIRDLELELYKRGEQSQMQEAAE